MSTSLYGFTQKERLHSNSDFRRVFKEGSVWHSGAVTLFVLSKHPGKNGAFARIGIVVPGKTGGAVQRNRLKRRLREIFRLNKGKIMKPSDIVVIGKKEAVFLNYSELEKKILALWRKAKIIGDTD